MDVAGGPLLPRVTFQMESEAAAKELAERILEHVGKADGPQPLAEANDATDDALRRLDQRHREI